LFPALALLALACSDDEGSGREELAATPSPQAAATAVDAAFAAALEHFDAVSDADCTTNNPQEKDCVSAQSQPSTVQRGIAVFGVGPPDGPGFVGVLGRDPAGEWNFWLGGQQFYQLLILPEDMIVCAESQRLNVRSAPMTDAPVVGKLEDLTMVRAEEFVLTEPGSGPQQGYGWFRLSSPLDGWAYSKYLTNASQGDCTLHDALEPGPQAASWMSIVPPRYGRLVRPEAVARVGRLLAPR
jgi:hypothetical protein